MKRRPAVAIPRKSNRRPTLWMTGCTPHAKRHIVNPSLFGDGARQTTMDHLVISRTGILASFRPRCLNASRVAVAVAAAAAMDGQGDGPGRGCGNPPASIQPAAMASAARYMSGSSGRSVDARRSSARRLSARVLWTRRRRKATATAWRGTDIGLDARR